MKSRAFFIVLSGVLITHLANAGNGPSRFQKAQEKCEQVELRIDIDIETICGVGKSFEEALSKLQAKALARYEDHISRYVTYYHSNEFNYSADHSEYAMPLEFIGFRVVDSSEDSGVVVVCSHANLRKKGGNLQGRKWVNGLWLTREEINRLPQKPE